MLLLLKFKETLLNRALKTQKKSHRVEETKIEKAQFSLVALSLINLTSFLVIY